MTSLLLFCFVRVTVRAFYSERACRQRQILKNNKAMPMPNQIGQPASQNRSKNPINRGIFQPARLGCVKISRMMRELHA
jgi:hypothetical protein